jgi:ATP-dependent Clp protease ATP-binding subunit ClpC
METDLHNPFTDRAREVMKLANQEAKHFDHEYIGTEHVLLGKIKEGNGVAATVLRNLKVDLSTLRNDVEKFIPSGSDIVTMQKLPQTPRTKLVVKYGIVARGTISKRSFSGTIENRLS